MRATPKESFFILFSFLVQGRLLPANFQFIPLPVPLFIFRTAAFRQTGWHRPLPSD